MNQKNIYVHILHTSELRKEEEKQLHKIVENYSNQAASLLDLTFPVNVTVYPKASWTISETGEGGYTPTEDWVQISIDMTEKKHTAEEILETRVPGAIFHEFNHLKRWQTQGFGETLEELLVTEGLAGAFEKEQWTRYAPPWLLVNEKIIQEYLSLIKTKCSNPAEPCNYPEWFHGVNSEIPKWLGYSVGFYIIQKALEKKPNETVLTLTRKPAKEILNMSGVNLK
ncbi:MAG TPA: DUF2268 domain-containing putative Zn-dependent protease [Candidatus Paceibacterota bacterium]|nr:DUF2268 domain-containing putative Zn-dependent protease [Candidatus Paceibacterota bacterium]